MVDKTTMDVGTKVKLTSVHHAMNPRLKENVGKVGIIALHGVGSNKRVLVSFGTYDNSWWVSPSHLTTLEQLENKNG